jgi:hypothetical protein
VALASTGPPVVIARDSVGNALGGIRLADMQAPTALNTGQNAGPGLCNVRGRTVPFDVATLKTLYRNHSAYVAAVRAATADNLRDGFILREDAVETVDVARTSIIGYGLPCAAECRAAQDLRLRTARYLIRNDDSLLKTLDAAALALAEGDGAAREQDQLSAYQRALRVVQRYAAELDRLKGRGQVTEWIAGDLGADTEALLAAIQGE